MNNWYYVVIGLVLVSVCLLLTGLVSNKFRDFYQKRTRYYIASLAIFGFALILLTTTIANRIDAKKRLEVFKEECEVVPKVVETQYDYTTFGVTTKILEYNEWLAKAKADLRLYGNWSYYCGLDIEELEYIGLRH